MNGRCFHCNSRNHDTASCKSVQQPRTIKKLCPNKGIYAQCETCGNTHYTSTPVKLDWCYDCKNWKQYCKCLTKEQRFERARILAEEVKHWTDAASVHGGLKRQEEQNQLRALDNAHRAQTQLIELLNDTRGESKTEDRPSA